MIEGDGIGCQARCMLHVSHFLSRRLNIGFEHDCLVDWRGLVERWRAADLGVRRELEF